MIIILFAEVKMLQHYRLYIHYIISCYKYCLRLCLILLATVTSCYHHYYCTTYCCGKTRSDCNYYSSFFAIINPKYQHDGIMNYIVQQQPHECPCSPDLSESMLLPSASSTNHKLAICITLVEVCRTTCSVLAV
jgi:hypothetical protein